MGRISTDERRQQFIEAASTVLREQGVTRATTRRIANEARAPLASLHYCFRSKEELFEAVLETLGSKGKDITAKGVTPHMGVANAVAAILRSSALWISSSVGEQLTDLEFNLWAFRSKKYKNLTIRKYREWVDFYRSLLITATNEDDPVLDLESIARMLLAVIDGFIVQEQYLPNSSPHGPMERLIVMMTRSIEHGDFDVSAEREGKKNVPTTARSKSRRLAQRTMLKA